MWSYRRLVVAGVFAAGAFCVLYQHVLVKLVHDWATDDNYSHGFLIVPIAAYLAWERRHALQRVELRPTALGLVVIIGSLAVLVAGTLGAELFLSRVSIIGAVAGAILFLGGWPAFGVLRFPVAFLLLMVPIPSIIFNQIAFPLQLLASRFGTSVISLAGVPVLREGNVLTLSNTTLEVAEACSGIRSLVSLLTMGLLLGYFTDKRSWVRTIVTLATVPIAILANGMRVAGTGIASYYYGPEAAEGFLHTFSGWLVFVAALALLLLTQRAMTMIAGTNPDRAGSLPRREAA
jgi:exosortase